MNGTMTAGLALLRTERVYVVRIFTDLEGTAPMLGMATLNLNNQFPGWCSVSTSPLCIKSGSRFHAIRSGNSNCWAGMMAVNSSV